MTTRTLHVQFIEDEYGSVARFSIDGRDLVEWVREFEVPFAGPLAGAYSPIRSEEVAPLSDSLPGRPTPIYSGGDGRSILLECECGEPGCWPLDARVVVTDESVTWTDFRQPYRPAWDYGQFGPFVFKREQYESALRFG